MATRREVDRYLAQWAKRGVTFEEGSAFKSDLIKNASKMTRDEILQKIRETQQYKDRFPAFIEMNRRDPGAFATEREYLAQEENYKIALGRYITDPKAVQKLSTPSKLAEFMLNDVSQVEVEDRLRAADNFIKNSPTEYKRALKEYYNIDDGDLTAFIAAPQDMKPLLDEKAQDMVRGVTLGVNAYTTGFNLDTNQLNQLNQQIENKYQNWTSSAMAEDVQDKFRTAQETSMSQSRLAGIEGEAYDPFAAVQESYGDVNAKLASKKRAERERARFGGSSGISQTSLQTQRNI